MPEDTAAALEWQEYQESLCSGCGLSKHETFAEPPPDWPFTRGHWDDRYDVDVLTCAGCAALQRKARSTHDHKSGPAAAGLHFAIKEPDW